MTIAQLTDMVQSTPFAVGVLAESVRRSALFETGAMMADAELDRMCKANVGVTFDFDYFDDLADDASNVGNDLAASLATANKVSSKQEKAHKLHRNNGWGIPNILKAMSAAGDPMGVVTSRLGAYWGRQYDLIQIAQLRGIIADNIANDSGDMVNDISAVSNGQKPTFAALADTQQTMGDQSDQLSICIMHSAVKNVLLKDQVTDKVYDAAGNLLYETILNKRIITSDSVYTNAGVYDTYMFKPGVFAFGLGMPTLAEEIQSAANAGNGEGIQTLWSRRHLSLHPKGFSMVGSPASVTATNAELATAAFWNRIKKRKQIGIAVLRSKLANAA
jgi:hypothetical protein